MSGWLALNADDPNLPGFDLPGQQGPVILHELGHLMGLGHVKTVGELMHPSGGGTVDLGPGDLEGLRQLGASGGCLPGDGTDRRLNRLPVERLAAQARPCREWTPELGSLHLQMVCTREAGTVGAMIPDRICCPA